MPFIQISLGTRPDPALARDVATRIGVLTAEHLRKDPKVTAIGVQFVPPAQWFVAGTSLADSGRSAFWVDIKITEGTNTKDEMSAYVDAVFASLTILLDAVEEESYVLVDGVPAYAYGYGGRTQERRFIEGNLA